MALHLAMVDATGTNRQAGKDAYILGQDRFVIGRDDECDWTLDDPQHHISARHCTIVSTDGTYLLKDHSTNGTFLNGSSSRVDGDVTLTDGSTLSVGSYMFVLTTVSDETARDAIAARSSVQTSDIHVKTAISARRGGDPAETAANKAAAGAKREAALTRIMPILQRSAEHASLPRPPISRSAAVAEPRTEGSAAPLAAQQESAPQAMSRTGRPPESKEQARGAQAAGPITTSGLVDRVSAAPVLDSEALARPETGDLADHPRRIARQYPPLARPDFAGEGSAGELHQASYRGGRREGASGPAEVPAASACWRPAFIAAFDRHFAERRHGAR